MENISDPTIRFLNSALSFTMPITLYSHRRGTESYNNTLLLPKLAIFTSINVNDNDITVNRRNLLLCNFIVSVVQLDKSYSSGGKKKIIIITTFAGKQLLSNGIYNLHISVRVVAMWWTKLNHIIICKIKIKICCIIIRQRIIIAYAQQKKKKKHYIDRSNCSYSDRIVIIGRLLLARHFEGRLAVRYNQSATQSDDWCGRWRSADRLASSLLAPAGIGSL